MSDELVRKMIEALREMAAKVDETVEREEPDFNEMMNFPRHGNTPTRKVSEPKYDRSWLSGRLLGLADAAEALSRPTPTDTGGR
jgi:hypothetical protein